jgi:hypothetical protein
MSPLKAGLGDRLMEKFRDKSRDRSQDKHQYAGFQGRAN